MPQLSKTWQPACLHYLGRNVFCTNMSHAVSLRVGWFSFGHADMTGMAWIDVRALCNRSGRYKLARNDRAAKHMSRQPKSNRFNAKHAADYLLQKQTAIVCMVCSVSAQTIAVQSKTTRISVLHILRSHHTLQSSHAIATPTSQRDLLCLLHAVLPPPLPQG